jgi:hypothetical protein
MTTSVRTLTVVALVLGVGVLLAPAAAVAGGDDPPPGFVSLFNGKDVTGWKVPEGDNGHWKVVDGVIDYDAESEAEGDKSLWTEKEYRDFVLRVDWRIKETPWVNPRAKIVMPDGSDKKGPDGKEIDIAVPDSDSGIYMRGTSKAQVNVWCWPVGSGEVYGYRTDEEMPPHVRAGVVPRMNADHAIGEWNTFEIWLQGDRLTVILNGRSVIEGAELPGLPERGAIALQHHGSKGDDGEWQAPPALVQFRNIAIQELE